MLELHLFNRLLNLSLLQFDKLIDLILFSISLQRLFVKSLNLLFLVIQPLSFTITLELVLFAVSHNLVKYFLLFLLQVFNFILGFLTVRLNLVPYSLDLT